MRGRRLVRRMLPAVVAIALAAGCADIPSSGPVTKVADDDGLGQSAVRYAPARPAPGASPDQIVRGFLDAMLAYPTSSRTASSFLTPAAARGWSPSSQVRVYSRPEVEGAQRPGAPGAGNDPDVDADGQVTVRLGFTEDAQLDRQGRYTGIGSPTSVTYTLGQVDGQWRITDPQDGLLVSSKFFIDYFRSFDLYFFDRPGLRLVPEPVYLVAGDQLATSLLTSLAGGPSPAARQATRTYVPGRTSLRPSVPVTDGLADVEFTDDFSELTSSAADHLSAQVVWTLRQVQGVETVQVVGGATALSAGGDEAQPVQAWGGFGPSTARGRPYAVIDDRVVEIDDAGTDPISGTWGDDARGVERIAVAESGVAGVLPGGRSLRVTARDGRSPRTIRGSGIVGPAWDPDGRLWVVDRPAGAVRVRIADERGAREIAGDGLEALDVTAFAVSPDGTRYAASVQGDSGGEMYVGRVLRDVTDRVTGLGAPQRVATTVPDPRAVSWSTTTDLSFLADSQAGAQVYSVSIDGSATTSDVSRSGALLPDVGVVSLVVGPGRSPALYATDVADRLLYLPPGGSWRVLDTPPVTALTIGR